ncbi:MAG TPA: hypothetical protein VLE50_01075 [Cellvibrio sp.]|nr:hypothetical protein [Cellvibrio sp.]
MFKACGFLILLFLAAASLADERLRDPTQPLSYSVSGPKAQTLVLNSILISSERKLAIINGQTLRENDVISGSNGVRIKHISANEVQLQQGTRQWKLSLNTTSVRQ